MSSRWHSVAAKVLDALQPDAGALLYLHAVPKSCEALLTALTETAAAAEVRLYVEREHCDSAGVAERLEQAGNADGVVTLDTGIRPQWLDDPEARRAMFEVTQIEESRKTPFVLCAIPTRAKALELRQDFGSFERAVLHAIEIDRAGLRVLIERALNRANAAEALTIRTAHGCELLASTRHRTWLADDGVIDAQDRRLGAIVSNLPAGSIYTTIVEDSATGSLWLSRMLGATEVTLHFAQGRVAKIEATRGAQELESLFDRHSGDSRRIGHIGVGLNPNLKQAVGWTVVDEHVAGSVFVSFGENRYMGGGNASSLNVDVLLESAGRARGQCDRQQVTSLRY